MKHLAATLLALLMLSAAAQAEDEASNEGPRLLPAARYFPSESGLTVSYRGLEGLPGDERAEWKEETYTTRVSPGGDVVFYEQHDPYRLHGPVFAAGQLLGVVGLAYESPRDGGSAGLGWAVDWGLWDHWELWVLPEKLTALGQQWTCPQLETNGDSWYEPPPADLTLTAAAIESIEVGGAEYVGCLRVDAAVVIWESEAREREELRAAGHYWLAPDLGPVLAHWRIESLSEEQADYWTWMAAGAITRIELVDWHWVAEQD